MGVALALPHTAADGSDSSSTSSGNGTRRGAGNTGSWEHGGHGSEHVGGGARSWRVKGSSSADGKDADDDEDGDEDDEEDSDEDGDEDGADGIPAFLSAHMGRIRAFLRATGAKLHTGTACRDKLVASSVAVPSFHTPAEGTARGQVQSPPLSSSPGGGSAGMLASSPPVRAGASTLSDGRLQQQQPQQQEEGQEQQGLQEASEASHNRLSIVQRLQVLCLGFLRKAALLTHLLYNNVPAFSSPTLLLAAVTSASHLNGREKEEASGSKYAAAEALAMGGSEEASEAELLARQLRLPSLKALFSDQRMAALLDSWLGECGEERDLWDPLGVRGVGGATGAGAAAARGGVTAGGAGRVAGEGGGEAGDGVRGGLGRENQWRQEQQQQHEAEGRERAAAAAAAAGNELIGDALDSLAADGREVRDDMAALAEAGGRGGEGGGHGGVARAGIRGEVRGRRRGIVTGRAVTCQMA